jgi:hypothetical protein
MVEMTTNPHVDADEQDILDKINAQEPDSNSNNHGVGDTISEILSEVDQNAFKNIAWWMSLPKRERYTPGDILYHIKFDRFGMFVQPARKEGLIRMRLFKLGSKTEVYTRDWFIDFEDVVLVKRGDHIKRGFAETEVEYVKRVGRNKILKREA